MLQHTDLPMSAELQRHCLLHVLFVVLTLGTVTGTKGPCMQQPHWQLFQHLHLKQMQQALIRLCGVSVAASRRFQPSTLALPVFLASVCATVVTQSPQAVIPFTSCRAATAPRSVTPRPNARLPVCLPACLPTMPWSACSGACMLACFLG